MSEVLLQNVEPMPAPELPAGQPQRRQPKIAGLAPVQSLASTVVIAIFVITFLVQAFQIPSVSMENTLLVGDYLLVDKVHFSQGGAWGGILPYQPIQRGDVVVFRYPLDPSKRFIKRVAALPGDRIRIDQGQVVVNGKPLAEPWVPLRFHDFRSCPETVVPPDSYFVLGDHRSLSHDSRDFGPVPAQYISGKAVFIYWPVEKLGALR